MTFSPRYMDYPDLRSPLYARDGVAVNTWPYGDYEDPNGYGDGDDVTFMHMFSEDVGEQGNSVPAHVGSHTVSYGSNATITADGVQWVTPDAAGATVPNHADFRIIDAGGDQEGIVEFLVTLETTVPSNDNTLFFWTGPDQRSWLMKATTAEKIQWQVSEFGTGTDVDNTAPTILAIDTLYYVGLAIDSDDGAGNRWRMYIGKAGVTDDVTEVLSSGVGGIFQPFATTEGLRVSISTGAVRIKGMRFRKNGNFVLPLSDFTAPLGFGRDL